MPLDPSISLQGTLTNPNALVQQQQMMGDQQRLQMDRQMQPYKIKSMQDESAMNHLKMVAEKNQRVLELLGSVNDQGSWQAALRQAKMEGLDTSRYENIPYSPDVVGQIGQQAIGIKGHAEMQIQAMTAQAMANYRMGSLDVRAVNAFGGTDAAKAGMAAMGVNQAQPALPPFAGNIVGAQQPVPPVMQQAIDAQNQDPLAASQAAIARQQQLTGVSPAQTPQYAALNPPPLSSSAPIQSGNVPTLHGMGGVIGVKANQIQADNPGMDRTTAMSLAQRIPVGMTVKNGQMQPIKGALNSAGQMEFTKKQQGGLGEAAAASALKEQGGQGETLAKQDAAIQSGADAAVSEKATYQDVMRYTNPATWTSGPLADNVLNGKRVLNNLGQMMGVDTSDLEKSVVDQQSMEKASIKLLRTATKELSSREAVQGMMMVGKSLPSTGMDFGTIQNIAARAQGMDDFMLAKAKAAQQWKEQNGGTLKGFDQAFRDKVNPDAFVFDYLPQPKQAELAKEILRQPGGVKMMQKIMQSRNYAIQQGYINAQ